MMSLLLKRSLPPKSRRDAMFIEKSPPTERDSPFMGDRESVALLKELLHFQMDLLVL